MGVSHYRFVDAVTAFLLPVNDIETKGRFRYAIDFTGEVSPLIVKESLAIRYQELQITNLRRIDGWVVNLGHATVVERVPDAARGRVSRSYRQFGAARPPWLNARPPRSESKITHELPRCPFANS